MKQCTKSNKLIKNKSNLLSESTDAKFISLEEWGSLKDEDWQTINKVGNVKPIPFKPIIKL